MSKISIVMPIAYDYRYSYRSLQSVYEIADEVVLGIDRDRISWSGKPYSLDIDAFRMRINEIDTRGIVRILEGDFHALARPMENEITERNFLANQCAPGNWIVQIDSDEQAINVRDFKAWLATADRSRDVQAKWITVFKTFGEKYLVVEEPDGKVSVATTAPGPFIDGRATGCPKVASNLILLHHSWGRTRDELVQKLTNWGHSQDFEAQDFLRLWDSVTLENFHLARDFHPLYGPLWRSLRLVKVPPPGLNVGLPEAPAGA